MTTNTLTQADVISSVDSSQFFIRNEYMSIMHNRLLTRFSMAVIFTIMFFTLFGCESADPEALLNSDQGSDQESTLIIGLTDAEGDFLSYTVDVVSLKMIKSNGAEIETLPLTTQLDFAQYIEVTEFLTAATVPSGHYTGAQIVLDYTNADIKVQDENGNAIDASVQDSDGNPVTTLTVDVTFNGESDFIITPGLPAHITLDFDLDASNTVVITDAVATVVVSPVLVADTILEEPKPHRLRGVLATVEIEENQFSVLMRPFRHREQQGFGQLTVNVTDTTSYEINGEIYASDLGLNEMSLLEPAAAVIVLGNLNADSREFTALEVYAGSSVPWGDKDVVTGNIVSRSGNNIVVRGATIVRADGSFAFNDDVSITLADTTTVVKQATVDDGFSIDDLSVGQRITVLGNITDVENLSLDATHVRMLFTNVKGTVVSASPLVVDLQSIDNRRIVLFDFSGTGADAISDADADNYNVDTGVLSLNNIEPGDAVKVRGHVTAFSMAPEDFVAQTIVEAANVRTQLVVGFGEGSVDAISSIDEIGILLNLDEAAKRHHLIRAGIISDLLELETAPLIKPRAAGRKAGRGLFVITRGTGVRVYNDYSSFMAAIIESLDGSTKILSVHASGLYDDGLNELQAVKINIRLI